MPIAIGIVAAFMDTFIANAFGVGNTAGIDRLEILFQVVVAGSGVSIAARVYGR